MNISITKRDINNAVRGSPTDCPIALALRRRFREAYIRVTENRIAIQSYRFRLTQNLKDFIDAFDHGGIAAVRPFDFDLGQLQPVVSRDEDEDEWLEEELLEDE